MSCPLPDSSNCFCCFPILLRRALIFLPKLFCEIALMVKATGKADVRDGKRSPLQELLAALQSIGIYKVHRGLSHVFFENLTAFAATDFSGCGDVFQSNGSRIVLINVRHHLPLGKKVRIGGFFCCLKGRKQTPVQLNPKCLKQTDHIQLKGWR